MGTLIKQELFKLVHKKGTWIGAALIVLVQFGIAALAKMQGKIFGPADMFQSTFLGTSMTLFVLIASTASIVSMEFQYGTVKQLLYRKFYRSQVFLSKVCVVVLHMLALFALELAVTFAIKFAIFPQVDLAAKYMGTPAWQYLLIGQGGEILTALLLLSFVLLMSTLFKTNAAAIACGYVGYFLISMASTLLLMVIARWHWVKWNPFTMLMLPQQLQSPDIAKATYLSNPEMIGGLVVYTVVFTLIAYLSFRKRNV
ncbi:ABC transporter permease [Lacticaseibacillus hulanensis]|uniref:ABC transporter permease n=1 Tax=Lacticaseibacillus hulanensis TaxID=2493111 RepID=UPI000FD9F4DA|nr:ABC transporter permease [Lacticaseibacillus hulanensis]